MTPKVCTPTGIYTELRFEYGNTELETYGLPRFPLMVSNIDSNPSFSSSAHHDCTCETVYLEVYMLPFISGATICMKIATDDRRN